MPKFKSIFLVCLVLICFEISVSIAKPGAAKKQPIQPPPTSQKAKPAARARVAPARVAPKKAATKVPARIVAAKKTAPPTSRKHVATSQPVPTKRLVKQVKKRSKEDLKKMRKRFLLQQRHQRQNRHKAMDNYRTHLFGKYKLRLVTIDEGDWLFTYFGHNAIMVKSPYYSASRGYNFGTFVVRDVVKLLNQYLQYNLQYWLSVQSESLMLYIYKRENRTYRERILQLTAKEKRVMLEHLREHSKPENKKYQYHHYTNNCSTKIRDAFAKAIGPDFHKYAQQKRGWTYRKHVMRKMKSNIGIMLFMDWGMGPFADKPLTLWEEMFLPDVFEAYVSADFWKNIRGRTLVGRPRRLLTRNKGKPFGWNVRIVVYGFFFFCFLLGLYTFRKRAFRFWLRTFMLFMTLSGAALFFMIFFTKMPEPPKNANVLFFHPFHVFAWWFLARKRWYTAKVTAFLKRYFLAHVALGVMYLFCKLIGQVPLQLNLHYFVFGIGLFGLAFARLRSVPSESPES